MKNRKYLLILLVLIVQIAFASEGSFIQLNINETKISDTEMQFSLTSLENVYGEYSWAIIRYMDHYEPDYMLNVYRNGGVIDRYSLYSSRYALLESFNESVSSEIYEIQSSIIETYIPYSNDIIKITVSYNGIETDLMADTSQIN